ncbi:hypothetical protein D9M71_523050 [compost metagenome]
MHIALDIGLALQLRAHAFYSLGQVRQLTTLVMRKLRTLTFADSLGVTRQLAQRTRQPPRQRRANQQAQADQAKAQVKQAPFGAVDVRLQRAVGLGHGNHANELAVVDDRRPHVHHRGAFIVGVAAGGAGTVLATQGQVHIVPPRIVLAQGLATGVQQHDALRVSDIDTVADLVLGQPPDLRTRAARAVGLEHFGQPPLAQGAGLDVIVQDLGQQVGGVYQCFFGGLAHHRADLFTHRVEQKVARQPDEQEVHQEDPDAQAHQAWSGL